MANSDLHNLLQRYAKGRCTPEEEATLMKRILDGPDAELEAALDRIWDAADDGYRADPAVSARLYGNVAEKLDLPAARSRALRPRWIGWAAALLCAAALAVYLYTGNRTGEPVQPGLVTYHANQRERITLPDGSLVTLNTGTILSYPASYGDQVRSITLSGEAFFDIRPDKAHPFTVSAADVTVEVLGTAFNVKAYQPDDEVTVTVTEGRVDVKDKGRSLGILQQNEQLVIGRGNHQPVPTARRVAPDEATAWHKNDLYFNNVTMEEAAAILRQRFGNPITFASAALRQCRFSGTLLEARDAASALEVICAFNNMAFSRHNGGFLIEGAGCRTP